MTQGSGDTPCYVGYKACGCAVYASVDDGTDDPVLRKETAKVIAEIIASGGRVERKTVQDVWNGEFSHKCEQHKKAGIL